MSVLYSQVVLNNYNPVFSFATISSINVNTIKVSTINADVASISTLNTSSIYANYAQISSGFISSISTTSITLDGNTLDTGGGGFGATLLLNGVPVATTANISSVAEWAYYPAISTIDCDQKDIVDCKDIFATNLTATNSISGVIGGFTTLNSGNITNTSNILTNTLQTTGLLQAASISTPSLRANLISTGTVNVSTLVGANAAIGGVSTNTLSTANVTTGVIAATSGFYSTINVSTITAGSVVFPVTPNLVVSSITVNGATTTQSLSVTSGATFTGSRPNFTAGIETGGANNFNNNNLDNVGRITANTVLIGSSNYVNINTSSFTTVTNDRGADVGGSSVINLISKFGQSTRVNITADASSALSPTPTQIVTLTANGATSLTQNAVGGRVSLVANAGSGSGCNILGFGQIDLTAFSSAPFPGVIKESAGSILAYSGVTVPAVGVPGCSFYSALACLSLTAGASPATTSFPGVVYLRGDNGTKVDNGFFSDTITATGNSVLPTITTNGLTAPTGSNLAFFATSQNIQFNSATVGFNANIAGAFSVSTITNVSTINGAPYVPGGGGSASTISTFTNLATSSFTVSSINGAAYPPSSVSSWVSTATTPLFMNDNYIDLRPAGFSGNGLSWGSVAPYSVGIDGPFLFGYTQGGLGTTSNANDISLAWDKNKVEIYKPMDMNGFVITDTSSTVTVSSINVNVEAAEVVGLAAGNPLANYTSVALFSTSVFIAQVGDTTGVIDINAAGNIQTTAFSTINSVQNTYFDGGISRRLDGVGVLQPVIQYGQVSSSGGSGTVIVSTPQAYTAVNTYLPFACKADGPEAEMYVSTLTEQAFEIGWSSGGSGAHTFNWQTLGT